jgi:phage portal protein BeeE
VEETRARSAPAKNQYTTPLPQSLTNQRLLSRDLSGKAFFELGYRRNSLIYALINLRILALQSAKLVAVDEEDMPLKDTKLPNGLLGLLRRPNPMQSWGEFVAQTELFLALGGVAYWLKVRDGAGVVKELWVYNSSTFITVAGIYTPIEYYKYDNGNGVNEKKRIEVEDVCRLTWGPHDWDRMQKVTGPMSPLSTLIDTDNEANSATLAILMRGAVPASLIELPPKNAPDAFTPPMPYSQGELEEYKQLYETKFGGSNRGSNMVGPPGTKITAIGWDPKKMMMSQFSIIPQGNAAQAFGVPLKMLSWLASNDNQTFNTYGEARVSFFQDTMIPHGHRLTGMINHAFENEVFREGEGFRVGFDWSRSQTLMDYFGTKIQSMYEQNSAKLNEARISNGLPEDLEFGESYLNQLVGGGNGGDLEEEPDGDEGGDGNADEGNS